MNTLKITGAIYFQRKRIKKTKIKRLQREINVFIFVKRFGKRENRTLEPSKGGMGIMLNKARTRFTKTMIEVIS